MEANTNLVRFYKHWVQNNFATEREGRPVGKDLDYVEIRGLGQDKQVTKRKVRPQDLNEYARQWDLYQRGIEQRADGTPLEQWPTLGTEEILMLRSHNIHTLEALCQVDDSGLLHMGPGTRKLQDRCKYYMNEEAPKAASANLLAQVDELRADNEKLATEVAQLRGQIDDLTTPDEAPRKPGRPRKATA